MTIDETYKLSTYKVISALPENSPQKIHLVMDEVTNILYVKKVLPGTDHFNFFINLASLSHKNLVKIHDVICCDGKTYVFEEYNNGQTLQSLLINEGVLPENKATDYIMQICDVLIYLHSQNPPIIHRDIKPENIILSIDDVIKLIDFDIAREFKQSSTRDTIFMGTREYAAPEQYGYRQSDIRTDIYAIGVLLHEMLTGTLPQNNITYKGPLQKIIMKCLRLEPKQRYQSVSALKKALVNTRFNHYKKIGIYALSAILVIGTAGYLYSLITQASSLQTVKEQNFDDLYNPEDAVSFPTQSVTEQSSDDLYNPEDAVPVSMQSLTKQDFDDLYAAFEMIESYEKKPTIILEQKTINEIIREITGDYYDSVVRAFQEYNYASPLSNNYFYINGELVTLDTKSSSRIFYSNDLWLLSTFNMDEKGTSHDSLRFIISEGDMEICYFDADLETTFYFTTNDDKGLLSDLAFQWIAGGVDTCENPVVFSQSPLTDITGIYYLNNEKKIEIFEEAGEMKFSYTDIRRSKKAAPLIVETIHKLDDNNYWTKNYSYLSTNERRGRLMFIFTENHLTILDQFTEEDNPDKIFGHDLKGIYNKS